MNFSVRKKGRTLERGGLYPCGAHRRRGGVQAFSRRENLKVNWPERPREGGLDHEMGRLCPAIFVKYGVPAKAESFCGGISRPRARVAFVTLGGGEVSPREASDFFFGEKVTKTPLRTCGSKDSLFLTGVRTPITGAWLPKGLLCPPRALRPAAAEHSGFLLPHTAPAAAGVERTASVRKRQNVNPHPTTAGALSAAERAGIGGRSIQCCTRTDGTCEASTFCDAPQLPPSATGFLGAGP